MQTGIELIAAERARQIEKLGYDADHDEGYRGQMAKAGACYADTAALQISKNIEQLPPCYWHKEWPWRPETFRGESPLNNLIKAGALIAAEIDRLQLEEK